jgi:hypothetical protein
MINNQVQNLLIEKEQLLKKGYIPTDKKKLIIQKGKLKEVSNDYEINNSLEEYECTEVEHLTADTYIVLKKDKKTIKVLSIDNSSHPEEIELYQKYYTEFFI